MNSRNHLSQCLAGALVLLIASNNLFAAPLNFKSMQYGMSIQEIESISKKKIQKNNTVFRIHGKNYILDYFRDSIGSSIILIFEDERFFAAYHPGSHVSSNIFKCFTSSLGQMQNCFEQALNAGTKDKVDLSTYEPFYSPGLKAQEAAAMILVAPLAVLFLPWILAENPSDKYRKEIKKTKSKPIFGFPVLGQSINVAEVYKNIPGQVPVADNLVVSSLYVKKNVAAFGVENNEVVWIINCKKNLPIQNLCY